MAERSLVSGTPLVLARLLFYDRQLNIVLIRSLYKICPLLRKTINNSLFRFLTFNKQQKQETEIRLIATINTSGGTFEF